MKVTVNGDTHETEVQTLQALFREIHPDQTTDGKAIAVNDEVISSDEWEDYRLSEGDRIEVIRAVQGG